MPGDELSVVAKELQIPYELAKNGAATGQPSVALFTAGGLATPADGVLVGSEIVKASRGLGEAKVGINVDEILQPDRPAERGCNPEAALPRIGRPARRADSGTPVGHAGLRRGMSVTAFSRR